MRARNLHFLLDSPRHWFKFFLWGIPTNGSWNVCGRIWSRSVVKHPCTCSKCFWVGNYRIPTRMISWCVEGLLWWKVLMQIRSQSKICHCLYTDINELRRWLGRIGRFYTDWRCPQWLVQLWHSDAVLSLSPTACSITRSRNPDLIYVRLGFPYLLDFARLPTLEQGLLPWLARFALRLLRFMAWIIKLIQGSPMTTFRGASSSGCGSCWGRAVGNLGKMDAIIRCGCGRSAAADWDDEKRPR